MKKEIICLIVLAMVSCKKEATKENCPEPIPVATNNSITYPDSIYYGKNVLALPDSAVIDTLNSNSFGAVLGNDATLKVKITRLAPRIQGQVPPLWFYVESPAVWLVQSDPSGGGDSIQTFTALLKGKIDLEMYFTRYGQNGLARLDFYENSSSVTKTKYIKWQ